MIWMLHFALLFNFVTKVIPAPQPAASFEIKVARHIEKLQTEHKELIHYQIDYLKEAKNLTLEGYLETKESFDLIIYSEQAISFYWQGELQETSHYFQQHITKEDFSLTEALKLLPKEGVWTKYVLIIAR